MGATDAVNAVLDYQDCVAALVAFDIADNTDARGRAAFGDASGDVGRRNITEHPQRLRRDGPYPEHFLVVAQYLSQRWSYVWPDRCQHRSEEPSTPSLETKESA